ncbi:hypothetical protein [Pantoea sp. FN0307]|uniref:hypothetical protein n=1 Tax=Pantoea sp. FN0307 TaxID=3418560 RepID=UPI003CEA9868
MNLIKVFIYLQLSFAIAFISGLVYLFFFIKRNLPKINAAFKYLESKGVLKPGDYGFYEQLGIWGAGFRISLLKIMLKGKTFKIKDGRMIDYEARKCLISSPDDFLWMKKYFLILFFCIACLLFIVLLAFILKSMGL